MDTPNEYEIEEDAEELVQECNDTFDIVSQNQEWAEVIRELI